MWKKAILPLDVSLMCSWNKPYTIFLCFLVGQDQWHMHRMNFPLQHTGKKPQLHQPIFFGTIITWVSRRKPSNQSHFKTSLVMVRIAPVKKVCLFHPFPLSFAQFHAVMAAQRLSNINFFKFSPLLSYKYSCLTPSSSSGADNSMYLLNDAQKAAVSTKTKPPDWSQGNPVSEFFMIPLALKE